MFSKSCAEWTSCLSHIFLVGLSHIFLVAIGASKLVNARFIQTIYTVWVMVITEEFSYSILCSKSYTKICVFKEFRNKPGLFPYICKCGEFLWNVLWYIVYRLCKCVRLEAFFSVTLSVSVNVFCSLWRGDIYLHTKCDKLCRVLVVYMYP